MQSFFTIWMHGAIEISCIIIAGAAGLTLGSGLVFPKTLSRMQSLQLSARRGLLIMLTIIPLIILAAFIEGFVTRYTGASYVVRGIVIFGSFAFIISYYVVYPWLKAKKGFTSFIGDVKLPAAQSSEIKYNQIKNSAQIFSDAFIFYRQLIRPAALISFLLAGIYTTIVLWQGDNYSFNTIVGLEQLSEDPWKLLEYTLTNVSQFLLIGEITMVWWLNVIASTIMAYVVLFWVQKDANKEKGTIYNVAFFLKTISATLICMIGAHLCLLATEGWLFLLVVFAIPILLMILATVFNENINLLSGIGRMMSVVSGNWVVMMGAYLVITTMCLIFLFMVTAPIAGFYLGVLVNALPVTDLELIRQGFYIFLYSYMLCFLFPLVFVVMGIGFFSFKETKEATDLFEQIPNIGVRKISYGMEKES